MRVFTKATLIGVGAASVLTATVLPAQAGATAASAPTPAKNPQVSCDLASFQAAARPDTTIVSVAPGTTPVANCQITGYVTTHERGTNQVNFQLNLPDTFNGRYLLAAQGGSAGFIPPPSPALLSAGYALAGTDEGNQSGGLDYRFAVNRAQAVDWDHLGVHVVTQTTQALTREYYATPKLYRYIDGCSGGGRSTVQEATYYPNDYDGALTGAPGINPNNILWFAQITQHIKLHPDSWIPPAKLVQLEAAILQKYDASDGAIDGLVQDPLKIKLTPDMLAIFTPAERTTLDMVVNGLHVFGQNYPGLTLSNPSGWSAFVIGTLPPDQWTTPLVNTPPSYTVADTWMQSLFGLGYDFVTQFNFASRADVNAYERQVSNVYPDAVGMAKKMVPFEKAGGKMVIWQGASDNAISEKDTDRFYAAMVLAGGVKLTASSVRMFSAPGVFHCGGGIGPQDTDTQALNAVTRWVEGGVAPKQLIAHSAANVTPRRTYLLCPVPFVAKFRGGLTNPRGLDINNAANWRCGSPLA